MEDLSHRLVMAEGKIKQKNSLLALMDRRMAESERERHGLEEQLAKLKLKVTTMEKERAEEKARKRKQKKLAVESGGGSGTGTGSMSSSLLGCCLHSVTVIIMYSLTVTGW